MSTTLSTTVNINDTFPIYRNVTATSCCGTVNLLLDDSFTEQMSYELPAINIDIYTIVKGKKVLYRPRALTIFTNKINRSESYVLFDIPQSCQFAITPIFDKNAFNSHNEMTEVFNSNYKWKTTPGNISKQEYEDNNGYIIAINGDEKWEEPTTTFSIGLEWDDTNINSSGGSSGSSPVPPTPTDLPPTLYYGVSANNIISTLEGLTTLDISQNTFNVTWNNINNEYQVIAYESGYDDITSITSDGFPVLDSFDQTTIIYNNKTYKVLVSENQLTFDTLSYIITFG